MSLADKPIGKNHLVNTPKASSHKLRLHVVISVSWFSLSRLGIRMRCIYTRGVKLDCV